MYKKLKTSQRDVMIQCLLLANHKKNKWLYNGNIYECNPGQFITSLNSLKNLCASDVTERKIRTTLKNLEKWKFLTNQSTKTGRLITICNWAIYQANGQFNDKENDKDLTKLDQTDVKELTTNKNNKEYLKNVKNKNNNMYNGKFNKRRNTIQEIKPIRSY